MQPNLHYSSNLHGLNVHSIINLMWFLLWDQNIKFSILLHEGEVLETWKKTYIGTTQQSKQSFEISAGYLLFIYVINVHNEAKLWC